MTNRILLSAIACTLVAVSTARAQAPVNALTAEEVKQGFVLLFDGTTTTNWRGYKRTTMPASWKVMDGTLAQMGGNEGGDDIVTDQEYGNFELRLQWRVAKDGNSGVMYRVSEQYEAPYESGPEMQVLDDAGHPDGKSRLTAAGSCFGMYPVEAGIVKPAGEWNEIAIIAKGAHVEHWLNGKKVVSYELWSDDWKARLAASKFKQWPGYGMSKTGHIALQDHGDAVAFRNIRIRKL